MDRVFETEIKNQTMIELKDLTKTYNGLPAVDRLNLSVERGEIFGFVGPNGAGKTTTIKMMGGILQPSAGTVKIAGHSMQEQPEKAKSKIGFIPDRPYLYEKLTGREFLRFTADLYRVPHNMFDEKAAENLALFALTDWADEDRILLSRHETASDHGRSPVARPRVIIVDEPMVGLDPAAILMVKELFRVSPATA